MPDQPAHEQDAKALASTVRKAFPRWHWQDKRGTKPAAWAALNKLVALAQRTEQAEARQRQLECERDSADGRAQENLERAEQAEKERDEWRRRDASECAGRVREMERAEAAEVQRDRLAAALERIDKGSRTGMLSYRKIGRIAREALNPDTTQERTDDDRTISIPATGWTANRPPRPDPDLGGDYAAEWDGEPPTGSDEVQNEDHRTDGDHDQAHSVDSDAHL